MLYRYRCRRRLKAKGKRPDGSTAECGGRRSLPKMIEFYASRPRCPSCKADTLVLDKYRMRAEVGKDAPACYCDGYPFPHRPGSLWCVQYKGERTEEDYRDRYYSGPGFV